MNDRSPIEDVWGAAETPDEDPRTDGGPRTVSASDRKTDAPAPDGAERGTVRTAVLADGDEMPCAPRKVLVTEPSAGKLRVWWVEDP